MIRVRFEGGNDIATALTKLSKRASKGVSQDALSVGAEPMHKGAASNAPRRPPQPDMADHIVVAPIKIREGESAAVAVGPETDYYYGLFQEIGTAFHGPHAFLRPAFDTNVLRSLVLVGQEYWRALASKGISRPTVSAPSTPLDDAFQGGGEGLGGGA